jgi:predicted ABC-class ATPase
MPTAAALDRALLALDGQRYPDYKQATGAYEIAGWTLHFDHAQGDPFAEPSRLRAVLPAPVARIPARLIRTPDRRVAAADFLNRTFHAELTARSRPVGSGKGGVLEILRPSQAVLRRTSLAVRADGTVEARFRAGLPADGRRIRGRDAARILCELVPAAVDHGLRFERLDADAFVRHVETVEDARALRAALERRGLVAFVGDGAILPRRSGIDDRRLDDAAAVPFRSPASLRVTLDTPNAGRVAGMGVPAGVTLLVGGGFHGKSTLLRALERGVYDHVPGDGRERVVTVGSAVKVRAEDGRRIEGVDISGFVSRLPGGEDTRNFRTGNASGSTSQAAAIVEALETGCRCLILDEDTSATNFLIRDARVQALVARNDEPITALIDRAREIWERLGVSIVMVVGGSGDYFDVADTVVAMRRYEPVEVTADAKRIAESLPSSRHGEAGSWAPIRGRVPEPDSIDPRRGRRAIDVRAAEPGRLSFGEERVELAAVEQLVEAAQTRAIGRAMAAAPGDAIDGVREMGEAIRVLTARFEGERLDELDPLPVGDYAEFRPQELAAAISRLRTLRARTES